MSEQQDVSLNDNGKTYNVRDEVISWVKAIVVSLILVTLIIVFVGRAVNVDGESMLPAFNDGDKIITANIYKPVEYGDVVVIKRKNDKSLIKRVIATGGQTIDIDYKKGEVFVDGNLIDEPYILEPTYNNLGMPLPAVVPQGYVFVMGDNRNNSDDSRDPNIGMVNEENIFGRVVFRIFPFDRFGTIE